MHDRPRVAIVTGQLALGGAEKQLTLLAQELQRKGPFAPVVFCLSHATEPYGSALSAARVEWHCPPVGCRPRLKRVLWFVRKLAESHCSLVYGVLNAGNVYGGAAALARRLPFVGSVRNADSTLSYAMRALSGFFCRRAQLVVGNSASCLVSLREDLGVQHQRVCIIPNAVVLSERGRDARVSLRREWGVPQGACIVGTVANLKPQKRAGLFLAVASSLHEHGGPCAHFVWIGEGSERGWAQQELAEQYPSLAGRVHFPGARLDVVDCLAAFDAFVLTSAYEGLPGALLEAMAAGLPCVATDVPGTRDVFAPSLDGEIGLLADANDPGRFAGVLRDLLQDPERMRRLGESAQRHVRQRYGLQAMVDSFSDVFRSAINQDDGHRGRLA